MKYEEQAGHSRSLGVGRVLWLALLLLVLLVQLAYPQLRQVSRLWPALLVSVAFALLARSLRAVSVSGAQAGALVSFLLYAFAGPGAFAALAAVFVLTWVSTRLGYARKLRFGKAESATGRSAAQVLANLSVAAICAAAMGILAGGHVYSHEVADRLLVAAMAAALAEAAADTVSSECGVAWSDDVRLITTGSVVPPGTDGGVSLAGTLAGVVAALAVTGICAAVRLVAIAAIPSVTAAAVLGMGFDSLLGATLERRRLLGNNGVNFASTAFAALAAVVMSWLLQ